LPTPLIATESRERFPAFSPNGRWLAYVSDASGEDEVHVRPFPNVGDAVWQLSLAGGTSPHWAHSGRELFYINGNDELAVVEVQTEPAFVPGLERVLFSVADYSRIGYDVSHDDQRFVMLKIVDVGNPETVLVLNFFEELKQRVGDGND
jgi:hypothetical protein